MRMFVMVAVVASSLVVRTVHAQSKRHGQCTGDAPDTSQASGSRVYRDCEVDKEAKVKRNIKATIPTIGHMPPTGCQRAEYEFVVDSTGVPETASVRLVSTNNRDLAASVLDNMPDLRYQPAQLDGRPVRQLTRYVSAMEVKVIMLPAGSARPSDRSMMPSRCK